MISQCVSVYARSFLVLASSLSGGAEIIRPIDEGDREESDLRGEGLCDCLRVGRDPS